MFWFTIQKTNQIRHPRELLFLPERKCLPLFEPRRYYTVLQKNQTIFFFSKIDLYWVRRKFIDFRSKAEAVATRMKTIWDFILATVNPTAGWNAWQKESWIRVDAYLIISLVKELKTNNFGLNIKFLSGWLIKWAMFPRRPVPLKSTNASKKPWVIYKFKYI